MAEQVAERVWQWKDWDDVWQPVVGMDWQVIVLANGQAVEWRDMRTALPVDWQWRLRYSVPVGGQMMEWKLAGRSGIAELAADMGHLELREQIRQMQAEERQLRGWR